MCVTMEWIDGTKMSDVAGLRAAGHDLDELADTLIQSFLRHTLRDGFFHADMHQGNLFVDPQGVIVAVDMGIVSRLGKKERRFLAEILYGFITRDYRRVADVHFEAGYVPARHDPASFAQAIRAIGEPIHGQPAETISMARLLTLLFEVTELFDMQTRPELVMLQKTMVVVEGVSRTLNPKIQHVEGRRAGGWRLDPRQSRPQAHRRRRQGRRHRGIQARRAASRSRGPHRAAFANEVGDMAEHGLRFDAATSEAIGKAEARHTRSGRVALWIIAAAAVWLALAIHPIW
jgi:ubiquinone biosynthesis protein